MTSFEDSLEPSIVSSNPEERRLARRLRIQRRLEAKTKQTTGDDEKVDEGTPIEKQILASLDLLESLCAEGDEVVSSVQVANDAREVKRRQEERETRKRLLEMLEESDIECSKRYEEVAAKWSNILSSKDPLDIHAQLTAQNAECQEILAKKDAVIAELSRELDNADLKFEKDRKQQNEDIDLLMDRMENQMRTMATAYRRELELIDEVIESDRKALLQNAMNKWEALYKKLQDDSRESLEKRKEIMQEYEKDMQKAIINHQEEFRAHKIKYELEIQNLQQEIENMKALCLMNVTKLDYSYAVLKAREEENVIVRGQQKRRINKLQDAINAIKKNYTEVEESSRAQIQKYSDQVLKMHKSILELQEKSDHFAAVNDRKYMQIWDMNIEKANELLDKILTADRIIHEQVLGIEWEPLELQLLRKEDLPSYRKAMDAIRDENVEAGKRKLSTSYKPAATIEEINIERRLLNHIMQQISYQCNYLVQKDLDELLSRYTDADRLIIRLDNVFQALDITSAEELSFLLNFFLPYSYCPTCKSQSLSSDSICCGRDTSESSLQSTSTIPDVCGEEVAKEEKEVENEKDDEEEKEDSVKRKLLCENGHLLEIETAFVSKALKEFVETYGFVKYGDVPNDVKGKYRKEKVTISRSITEEDMKEFWKRYREVFTEDKEKLWDVLLVGLKKYYAALKERHLVNMQTEALRKQNAELERLLNTQANDVAMDENLRLIHDAL